LEHEKRFIRLFTKVQRNVDTRLESDVYKTYYRFEER